MKYFRTLSVLLMLCKFPSEQVATSVSRVFSSAQIATSSNLSVKSNSAWHLTIALERTELNVAITTPSKNFEHILLLRYRLRNKNFLKCVGLYWGY